MCIVDVDPHEQPQHNIKHQTNIDEQFRHLRWQASKFRRILNRGCGSLLVCGFAKSLVRFGGCGAQFNNSSSLHSGQSGMFLSRPFWFSSPSPLPLPCLWLSVLVKGALRGSNTSPAHSCGTTEHTPRAGASSGQHNRGRGQVRPSSSVEGAGHNYPIPSTEPTDQHNLSKLRTHYRSDAR